MGELQDIVDYNLKIIFIGFNPGMRSAQTGHHYAGHSNNFWKLLYDSGLTPYKIRPEEDFTLLKFGYGSTNIAARPTASANELSPKDFREGAVILRELLEKYKPRVACYVGIGVYKAFSGLKAVQCGFQTPDIVDGVLDYVCSSPSGLNRKPYREQLECFGSLNAFINT
jgi:double-stranded uracil-DNA glycosylase